MHVVYSVGHLDLGLNIKELRSAPCHSLILEEYSEKFLCIRFKPCTGTTQESVVQMHIRRLRKKYKVKKIEIYDDIIDYKRIAK